MRGRVTSGRGDLAQWMRRHADRYAAAVGHRLEPGSLNVVLDEPWSMGVPSVRLEASEVGVGVGLVPCTLEGRPCWVLRTDANEAGKGHHERDVVEVVAAVHLRTELGLQDGDEVQVHVGRLGEVQVRDALEGDLPATARLVAAESGGSDQEWLARFRNVLADPSRLFLVAEANGRVVGFGQAREVQRADAASGWYLSGVTVAPECRRRGVGLALTEARLERLGDVVVHYVAEPGDHATVRLHERLGFRPAGTTSLPGSDRPLMLFRREAGSPPNGVLVVPYRPEWPELFAREAARLGDALRPWAVGPVEHVGSTAVPGLAAKPVLDLLAPVADLREAVAAVPVLARLGYVQGEHRPHEALWLRREQVAGDPTPVCQLHLTRRGSALWQERLAFRDALRRDAALRADYQALKVSLAASTDDLRAYTDGKRTLVTRVLRAAGLDLEPPRRVVDPISPLGDGPDRDT